MKNFLLVAEPKKRAMTSLMAIIFRWVGGSFEQISRTAESHRKCSGRSWSFNALQLRSGLLPAKNRQIDQDIEAARLVDTADLTNCCLTTRIRVMGKQDVSHPVNNQLIRLSNKFKEWERNQVNVNWWRNEWDNTTIIWLNVSRVSTAAVRENCLEGLRVENGLKKPQDSVNGMLKEDSISNDNCNFCSPI